MEASEGNSPEPLAISHCQHYILKNITKKKNAYKKRNQEGGGGNLSVLLLRVFFKKVHTVRDSFSIVKLYLKV